MNFGKIRKHEQELLELATHDALSPRFEKEMKARGLTVDRLIERGSLYSFWYLPAGGGRERHPDGSESPIPLDRIRPFLEHRSLFQVPKTELQRLEKAIGARENEILTNSIETRKAFLCGVGMMSAELDPDSLKVIRYVPNKRLLRSKRLQLWEKAKEDQATQIAKQRREAEKQRKKMLKQHQKSLLGRLKRVATGRGR